MQGRAQTYVLAIFYATLPPLSFHLEYIAMDVLSYMQQLGCQARAASRIIAMADTGKKNAALLAMADAIEQSRQTLRSEEHTSELQSRPHLVCRLLLEKKKKSKQTHLHTFPPASCATNSSASH